MSKKLLLSRKLPYFTEGAVSHNALYYQQLSIARYQVSFMVTIIWRLPIVSVPLIDNCNDLHFSVLPLLTARYLFDIKLGCTLV